MAAMDHYFLNVPERGPQVRLIITHERTDLSYAEYRREGSRMVRTFLLHDMEHRRRFFAARKYHYEHA